MKRFRKLVSLMLCLMLTMVCLSGCSETEQEEIPNPTVVMTMEDGRHHEAWNSTPNIARNTLANFVTLAQSAFMTA